MFKIDFRAGGAAGSFDARPTGDSCRADGLCVEVGMVFRWGISSVGRAREERCRSPAAASLKNMSKVLCDSTGRWGWGVRRCFFGLV